ncbi:uncharacterized protein LOC132700719 isoform X2 [Cylas formicarius]|uniref:uncharacterized protein LOC132700719 isoform X2 n=1 Tax=Cylas formicarius TaxID=197179 RepID=UPI002958B217|nr:uncharacterized protein LOC132700719 isoform X2 [Cylas formicarius]
MSVTPPLSEAQRRRDVFRRLREAKAMLLPVVEQVVDLKAQYLTRRQFQDAKTASKLLKSVVDEVPELQVARYLRNVTFDTDAGVGRDSASVYVGTGLLLQLVDLRDFLDEIETHLDEVDVQESSIVNILTPLIPSRTEMYVENDDEAKTTPSTEEVVQVTDVGGAREIIAKCIRDLEILNVYLSKRRADAASGRSETDLEDFPTADVPRGSVKIQRGGVDLGRERCCCSDPCIGDDSQDNMDDGCDEDKVVICIKGRTEDEGDIRVVVRQCPDCRQKQVESFRDSDDAQRTPRSLDIRHRDGDDAQPTPRPRNNRHLDGDGVQLTPIPVDIRHDDDVEDAEPTPQTRDFRSHDNGVATLRQSDAKSTADADSVQTIPSVTEAEESRTSLRNFIDLVSDEPKESEPAAEADPQVYAASCSRLRLYDTARLCVETDKGDELLISLTVTPTNKPPTDPDRILEDLFGDDVEKKIVPVMRTKICSSLDFDVTAADTKIRRRPIRHRNASIVVRLHELGVDNLLRACRPAKCCRKAVLGEKTTKSLPYPASLTSLPLDDEDVSVIDQSLRMSVQKVKNSTDLRRDGRQVYRLAPKLAVQTIMYCFVRSVDAANVRRTCSYYVNLVRDEDDVHAPPRRYDVMYFAVHHSRDAYAGDGGGPRPPPRRMPRAPPLSKIPVYRGRGRGTGRKIEGNSLGASLRGERGQTGLGEPKNVAVIFESETSVVSSLSNAQLLPSRSCLTGICSPLIGLGQIAEDKSYKMGTAKYLVYNNDARSSMFRKLVDKTKESFSCANDEATVCSKCRCYTSNCPVTETIGLCSCPDDNRHVDDSARPKTMKQSLGSRLKKSLSSVVDRRSAAQEAHLCGCSKRLKNAETMCSPPNLRIVKCQSRLTQTCECEQCDAFSDDGSCYCSHCLGSLDKGSVAKPASADAAISYRETDAQILYSFVTSPPAIFR